MIERRGILPAGTILPSFFFDHAEYYGVIGIDYSMEYDTETRFYCVFVQIKFDSGHIIHLWDIFPVNAFKPMTSAFSWAAVKHALEMVP